MFPEKIPGSAVVKSTAKAALTGKYLGAAVAALLPVFAYYLLNILTSCAYTVLPERFGIFVTLFSYVFTVFAIFPLFLGVVRFFWRLTDGLEEAPVEAFCYFGSFTLYKRAIKSAFIILFKFLTVFIPSMLPYYVTVLLSNTWLYQFLGTEIPLWVAGLALLSAFLKYAGIFVGLILFARYYLFAAVVVMDDELLLYEAVHISTMISSRSAGAFAALIVSLIGWILLSLLIVPMIYTAPLILSCFVIHCRYTIVNHNRTLEFYSKEQL